MKFEITEITEISEKERRKGSLGMCKLTCDKLTWQVNLTSHNFSCDLKRGKRASWQVKLSSQLVKLSSGTCHQSGFVTYEKNMPKIAIASEKVFARFSGPFLCPKNGQDVKYDRDITPRPHLFHGTNSRPPTDFFQWVFMSFSATSQDGRIPRTAGFPGHYRTCLQNCQRIAENQRRNQGGDDLLLLMPVSCLRPAPIRHQKRGQPAHHRHAQCWRWWRRVDTSAGKKKSELSQKKLQRSRLPERPPATRKKQSPPNWPARQESQIERRKRWATNMSLYKNIWWQQKT